jgi:hypothetical protein
VVSNRRASRQLARLLLGGNRRANLTLARFLLSRTLRKCLIVNDLRGAPAQVLDSQRLTTTAAIPRRARFVNDFRENLSENTLRFFLCAARFVLFFEHEKRMRQNSPDN